MVAKEEFDVWDWFAFVAMLVISAGIGIFYAFKGRRENSTNEFLMGGGDMKMVPVSISILVSFMSAILILGTPAEMFTKGTQYFVYTFGVISAVVVAANIFVPLIYPLKLTSSFEYLEKRFDSKAAKLTGTIMMILQQVIYMGIASYAPSTALEAVTGFPTWATVITVGLVSTFYTFLGGMKAVVWTDVFQSFVMVAGILAIVIQGTISVGGLEKVWHINKEWDRIEFFDFNPDPTQRHSFWSLVVGGMVGWTATYGVNQASVQRYCALPTLKKAKTAVLLNIIGVFVLVTITCLAGIVVFAYYAEKGCDPLSNEDVSNSNQIIPFFVMEKLGYPGLPGLFVACLFSGALSTMSSCLNALSAVTWEDILKPCFYNLSEEKKTWVTRGLVIFYGGCGIGMSFMAMNLGGTVLQASLSFTGAASGPLLGIFVLGAFFPWANWIGAVVGSVFGLVLPMWISIGAYSVVGTTSNLPFPTDNCTVEGAFNATTLVNISATTLAPVVDEITGISKLYTVSYLWYPSIGAATVVVIGLIVSFCTGANGTHDIDPKYLIPFFDRIFCCLPNSLLRKLRCNMEFPDPEDIKADELDEKDTDPSEPGVVLSPITTEKPDKKPDPSPIALVGYKQKQDNQNMYPHLEECNGGTYEYINGAYTQN
ncbi:sodium-coupled monocarboxylate transporter 1-like isoform X2 [Mizuhopecten yessoensis]|uniref:Sodium-dependent glucose transporter 1 n=1 Tax=Mizuhopecten yessoensis TaxID=6573 RepID=A0A210QJW1_MIZYE|nr:sodium-coupled monocarboxylate transporter 1-like isoform X2 [Mizuhopecten yessoensis]OWF48976.1 sodium-coupled monocarboxylate transporter 1 [Mizuhopecten yessoensis]